MDPLASFAELQAYMPGVTLDEDQATMLLKIASDTVRGAAGRQVFTLVEDDELVIRGSWRPEILLPQRPVIAVASVTVGDTLQPDTAYEWSSDGHLTLCPWSDVMVNGPTPGYPAGPEATLAIVYSHGYAEDDMPWDIKGMVLDVTRRSILTPDAGVISQESLGSHSVSYSRETAATLTSEERRKLRVYRYGQTTVSTGP